MVRRALILPVVAGVLALPACGGGGMSKGQYAASASRLCRIAADQFRELHLDRTVGAWRHAAPEILRIDQEFADKLAALRPPARVTSAAAAYAKATAKTARDDRDAIAAARAGNAKKLRAAIAKGNRDNTATFPSARKIGAQDCYIG